MTLFSLPPGRGCSSVSTYHHPSPCLIWISPSVNIFLVSRLKDVLNERMPLVLMHRLQREPQEHHKQQGEEKTTQLQGAVSCAEDDWRLVLRLHQTLPHVSRRPPRVLASGSSDLLASNADLNPLRVQLGSRQADDARRGFTTRVDPGGKFQQSATKSQADGEDGQFAQQGQQQRADFPQTDEQEAW